MRFLGSWLRAILFLGILAGWTACTEKEPTLEESLGIAIRHIDAGHLEQGIGLLEDLNRRFPANPEILEPLAFANSRSGAPMEAGFYFSKLFEVNRDRPEFLLYAAQAYLSAEDPRGASLAYRKYLEERPRDAVIWKTLGQLREDLNQPREAIAAYIESFRLRENGEIAARVGKLFLRENNLPQAANWFRTALDETDGAGAQALLGFIDIAMRQRDYETAERLMRELDAVDATALATSPLAGIRGQLTRWREQQDALSRQLGEQQRLASEMRERAAREAEAAARPADSAPSRQASGSTGTGSRESTSSPARESTSATPSTPASPATSSSRATATATTTYGSGSTQGSVSATASRSSSSAPSTGDSASSGARPGSETTAPSQPVPTDNRTAAEQLMAAGDYSGAIAWLRSALAEDDSQADLWSLLAEAYLAQSQPDTAEFMALEAMRRDPDEVAYRRLFLSIASRTKTPGRYLDELLRAREDFPQDPDITLLLARAFRTVSRSNRNAALLYRSFLAMAPDHPEADAARRELEMTGF